MESEVEPELPRYAELQESPDSDWAEIRNLIQTEWNENTNQNSIKTEWIKIESKNEIEIELKMKNEKLSQSRK